MNNQTSKVIYQMLTESTGKHFLDSGGEDGRYWQRNQKRSFKDFQNEPEIYKDDYFDNPNGRSHIIADVQDFMNEYIYPDTEADCTYTYNFDNCLSQDIQWISSGEMYQNDIIALCIHNGADARGGMTDYKFFKIDPDMFYRMDEEYYRQIA